MTVGGDALGALGTISDWCWCYSLGSLVWLFVLTKLMGNRQMSQLTLFDYIIGISIGSIAAEMASHPEEDSMAGADRHDRFTHWWPWALTC